MVIENYNILLQRPLLKDDILTITPENKLIPNPPSKQDQ
jgi:hypothetical protein